MTPAEHKTLAEEFAEKAARVYSVVKEITEKQGGVEPHLHAALFREMHATAALAQVHATLAAAPVTEEVDL
jgi:hypothetical protein